LFAGQIIARAPIGRGAPRGIHGVGARYLASHCEPVLAGYRVHLAVRKLSRARVLDLTLNACQRHPLSRPRRAVTPEPEATLTINLESSDRKNAPPTDPT